MKKAVLSLKIGLILILGAIIPLSVCMFPALLFDSSGNPEILRMGYGYLAVFILSCIMLFMVIRKEF